MNDNTDDLLRQLEQATAIEADLPPDADQETAQLRQSWLNLTRLLQAADASWDASTLRPQALSPAKHHHWKRLASVAIAASLLLAIGALWLLQNMPSSLQPNEVEVVSAQNKGAFSQNATQAGSGLLALADDEFAWNDTLDEQLSDANRAILSLRYGWQHSEATFVLLQDQLQRIQQELETGSL